MLSRLGLAAFFSQRNRCSVDMDMRERGHMLEQTSPMRGCRRYLEGERERERQRCVGCVIVKGEGGEKKAGRDHRCPPWCTGIVGFSAMLPLSWMREGCVFGFEGDSSRSDRIGSDCISYPFGIPTLWNASSPFSPNKQKAALYLYPNINLALNSDLAF